MRKILIGILILTFILAGSINTFTVDGTIKSVETILKEIQQEQNVQSTFKIDPAKVSMEKLEELGDSVMDLMIGNSELHYQMDLKLGGSGSASLNSFHARLGFNFLKGYPNGMLTLMIAGMNGNNGSANKPQDLFATDVQVQNGIMGTLGFGGLFLVALILMLLMIILFLIMKTTITKPIIRSLESPIDVLKRRYANGEISKEEFEKMAEHLGGI